MIKSNIQDIVNDLGLGKMVIIVDDEDRENEGDLIISSQYLTPEHLSLIHI